MFRRSPGKTRRFYPSNSPTLADMPLITVQERPQSANLLNTTLSGLWANPRNRIEPTQILNSRGQVVGYGAYGPADGLGHGKQVALLWQDGKKTVLNDLRPDWGSGRRKYIGCLYGGSVVPHCLTQQRWGGGAGGGRCTYVHECLYGGDV
ncbi:MAG: hypothetical protein WCI20_03250 [bacterium]